MRLKLFSRRRSHAPALALAILCLAARPLVAENGFEQKHSKNQNHEAAFVIPNRLQPQQIEQQQKTITITGRVLDVNSEAVIGATVVERGNPSNGSATDVDGYFSLTMPADGVIVVSYVGYETQEVEVQGRTIINIAMFEATQTLGEFVVTALGIKRAEKSLGYAVQKVDGESLSKVKGVNVATSLSGKIAGVNVRNSTEFNTNPSILIRGKSPLLVIDGVPYAYGNLSQVPADNIAEITVLKGMTASALYGARGQNGAIMVTTKRGQKEGLDVEVTNNTMFSGGYLRIPEPQTSYSTGNGGRYDRHDYVWGDKMDIGRTAVQYNPETYEWEERELVSEGRDNFRNFLETSIITNSTVSVAYKASKGSVRASFNHLHNKGQYPNLVLNKFNYTVSGKMDIDRFHFDGSLSIEDKNYPQDRGAGYGATGYIYNFLVWTGTDFDVRKFKNYWKKGKENVEQNWWNPGWYDNPYFLAYANTHGQRRSYSNGQFNMSFDLSDWSQISARTGYDYYSQYDEYKTPLDKRGSAKGGYSVYSGSGRSLNSDVMLTANRYLTGTFRIDALLGASAYYYQSYSMGSSTSNGLLIPGFFSLNSSRDPATTSKSITQRQINSLFGKMTLSWNEALFAEVAGRNDWASTLAKSERSYFYPSFSGSAILSELINMPDLISFWKLRGSWSVSKSPAGVYSINKVYSINPNEWDSNPSMAYPSTLYPSTIKPETVNGWEIGTGINFLSNRLRFDMAYYQEIKSNIQRSASISDATGFGSTLINIDEQQLRRGVEVSLTSTVMKTNDLQWNVTANWALDRYYYHKIDPMYSTQRPWVKEGERWDWMSGVYDWMRDGEGNIIHVNGKPVKSSYELPGYYEFPDWIWGLQNEVQYKDWTLAFSFDGRVGGYGYNQTEQAMWNSGTHPGSDNEWRYDEVVNGNKTGYVGQGVKVVSGSVVYDPDEYGKIKTDTREYAPNDVAVSYQSYVQAYQPWSGNRAIQNVKKMTFFKLRELSLGYSVPAKIARRMSLNNMDVSLVGQNLLIWSPNFKHSDPDVSSEGLNSPSVRYVGFNVKFSF